ncbi:MAG: hypothetical protein HW401_724 [Parcubacteria group bacterium]|nr:hypothetical protein [Parcubacteria group bacterium]
MKISPILFIFVLIGTLGSSVDLIIKKNSEIRNLKEKVSLKESYIEENDVYVKVSLRLLRKPFWYVFNNRAVSSLPNGEGEYVILTDRPLSATGNRLGVKHPVRDTKVTFLPNTSNGNEANTIEGGWLTYQYID